MDKLLKKAARGHERSQLKVYNQYYGYCMSVALRYSSTRDEASEVVHDSFVKVFTRLDTYDPRQPFKGWLRRVVINSAIDHYRRYSKHTQFMDVVETDEGVVEADAISQLSAEEILEAVAGLPPKYRMVFSLYVIEGFKHEEIAEKLGISAGTSKSNLSKARVKLQRQLKDRYHPGREQHG